MAITSLDEKKWQAESDARTLASYQEILQDKSRMAAATKQARIMANDLNKRASAMTKAAGGAINKSPRKTSVRTSPRKK